MIPRYSRESIAKIWEDDSFKYNIWLKIELLACAAQAKLGKIPEKSLAEIQAKANFNIDRINEIEQEVKHDIIAFLTSVAEYVGADSRFIHMGLTSSDIVDTCFSYQLKVAGEILLKDIEILLEYLAEKAQKTKYIIIIGRSHGIHAEPITLGLKFARFYQEFKRHYYRLENAIKEISICKISGAMGQFANIDPSVEEYVAKNLGLTAETIATQIIPRDRHAMFFATLAIIASSIENIATEIRHSQRTELTELGEQFTAGQKGSSAMPHKKNPILSENLTGLARIIRSSIMPALENITLWHERDISHSAAERIMAPMATVTLDFALHRLAQVIKGLVIFEANIEDNLQASRGLIFSQKVLLELIEQGFSREEAYKIVQRNALKTWDNKQTTFLENLKGEEQLKPYIKNIEAVFEYSDYIKNVDYIFSKVF